MNLQLRKATSSDIPHIHELYAREVRDGVATYEYDVPAEREMARRMAELLDQGYPYLVAELEGKTIALVRSESPLALLPVEVTASAEPKRSERGEPVAVYLRSGHLVKIGRGFDEEAFARVVAVLEGA